MDSFDLNTEVCRICLDSKVILNWNEEIFEFSGVSYKDCYWKYTQLDSSDCYPTNLCEICADELRNAHFLFEKAVESYNILRVALKEKNLDTNYSFNKDCSNQSKTKYQNHTFDDSEAIQFPDNISPDNSLLEPLTNAYNNNDIEESESVENNLKEISIIESATIEPVHFVDIQNFESSAETLLEENLSQTATKVSFENKLNESYDTRLINSSASTNENTSETLLEQNLHKNSDTKSVAPSSTNQSFKTRKKYILICQYCSLKVDGTNQLKTHEATHNKNRKRTETCPHCGVKLYTKMALNEHIKIHDKNREKKHKCEFCEKAFFNKGALNVHRRIHLGLMVKCQLCMKEFFRQIDLDKHLLTHSASPVQKHVGKKLYVVQCKYCNKSVFTNKWKEHEAAHLNKPQVKCKICDKKFFARSKCSKHLKQVHHKKPNEYEDFIHFFVDRNTRITNLIMKQKLTVQPVEE